MSNAFILPGSVHSTNTTLAAHRAKKKEFVDLFDELFAVLKEGEFLPGAGTITVTQKSHPSDFALNPVSGVEMEAVMVSQNPNEKIDIIVYRTTFDREVAFGLWNGRYIEQTRSSTCVIMRPMRFVEVALPDSMHTDGATCEQAYDGVQSIADQLATAR